MISEEEQREQMLQAENVEDLEKQYLQSINAKQHRRKASSKGGSLKRKTSNKRNNANIPTQ